MQRVLHSPLRPHRLRGFTAIELAIAAVVLVALSVLLLPALSAARQSAIVSSCLANQTLLGVGYNGYIQDYNQLPGMGYHEAWVRGSEWGQG